MLYCEQTGTSMAAPVTAGVAAFILGYYPNLTAPQLKTILEKTAVSPKIKVTNPGNGEEVFLGDISKTGGMLNAFEAVKLASQMAGEKKPAPVKTKVKVKEKKVV